MKENTQVLIGVKRQVANSGGALAGKYANDLINMVHAKSTLGESSQS